MENKDRLEMLRWLIERGDTLRASYANRASIILSADALLLATIVFLSDKVLGQVNHPRRSSLSVFIIISVLSMCSSFILAMFASASLRWSSRKDTKFKGPMRYFYNATDTFKDLESFDSFHDKFVSTNIDEFIKNGCAEMWVGHKLQRFRYNKLKVSILLLFVAVISLVIASGLAFLPV
jgi:hypothetical protein